MRSSLEFAVAAFALIVAQPAPARAQSDGLDDESAPAEEGAAEGSDSTTEEKFDVPPGEPSPFEEEEAAERARKRRKAPRKFHLALRTGYGAPLGEISDGVPLASDTSHPIPIGMSGMIPVHLDLGYMAFPKVLLGLYFQYGVAFYSDCGNCSGSDIRFGIQTQYHFVPQRTFDPWLGLGLGYEFLRAREHDAEDGNTSSFSAHGFEFANLQAGLDIALGQAFTLGPFVSFSLGQFGSAKTRPPGGATQDSSIDDTALHMWLEPGFKATLRL
jgi:hypothetical protein